MLVQYLMVFRYDDSPSSCVASVLMYQVYADPDSCNRFYKCENGIMSLETCENGLLFDQEMALTDGIHNYCVYNWRVECGDRVANNTPDSSPGCEYKFGIFSKADGCHSSYIKCEHGKATEVTSLTQKYVNSHVLILP